MIRLSAEQQSVVDAPLVPLSVIACAGSGKTRTAVHRLAAIRQLLGEQRGRVALLSFSNVAVDTFRKSYQVLARNFPAGIGRGRVEIDTLDGFITANILRPHSHRTMGAAQAAYLVTGNEPFLNGFTFTPDKFPIDISKMQVGIRDGALYFYYAQFEQRTDLGTAYAGGIVARLGRTGAYTHNLGRYWCYRTLREQPAILRALARRYPHILVDESQDIGSLHQAILEVLVDAGVQISLIGDPHQGIYEFAGADGKFLVNYRDRAGVAAYALTRNYRSAPALQKLANEISARADTADRAIPGTHHGAFFIGYRKDQRQQLMDAFCAEIVTAELKLEESAVICRSRTLANELAGVDAPVGQGLVKDFVSAALLRDKHQDYQMSFKTVTGCIVGLLKKPPHGLVTMITQPARYPEMRSLRREFWNFTRNVTTGLPSSALIADTQWHPLLLLRIKELLQKLQTEFGLSATDNVGRKLAKTKLPNAPLATPEYLVAEQGVRIRVDTVHQVKGESLDAVLYVAAKDHVQALLAGMDSEVGRIGYVAITRARNLLWLAVPANALKKLRPALLASGFQEAGIDIAKVERATQMRAAR